MSTRFFGRFLIDRGCITADQLQTAVATQSQSNQPLGRRAVEQGYMKSEDAQWLNQLQRTRDRRFGELAVETGMLTENQLGELLISQAQDWILLGEALVTNGCLTQEELALELDEFSRQEQQAPENIEKLYSGRRNSRILEIFADVTTKIFLRVCHERLKIAGCHGDPGGARLLDYTLSQRFTGGFEGVICLNLSTDILLRIAGKMLDTDLLPQSRPDDDALDGATEFLNIICGHVCIKLGNLSLVTELLAPEIHDNSGSRFAMARAAKNAQFTATDFQHPESRVEMCLVDRSRL